MYMVTLYDGNCSPICDGTISVFVDSLEDFEKYFVPLHKDREPERVERYFKSKSGEIVTDYYTDDPAYNIVQQKEMYIFGEKSYSENDVTKIILNCYGFSSTYHIDEITYYIRYVLDLSTNEYLKLCCFKIRGICYDHGQSLWMGDKRDKYSKIGFENCKHLASQDYLPVYHFFEGNKRVAMYQPRYSQLMIYGNQYINKYGIDFDDDTNYFSDDTDDYKDVHADLYVWKIVKTFDNEAKLKSNMRHYKLGKLETQILLNDLPGEAG